MMRPTWPQRKGQDRQERPVPRIESKTEARAASPWAPLRRLMWLSLGLSVAAVAAAMVWLQFSGAPMRWELLLAVTGGIAGTLLLTGALMGLVFVSNQSGHDANVGRGDGDGD
jgi:hypothetical protein